MSDLKKNKTQYRLFVFLVIFMALRIATYYALFPENIALTRVIKIGGRFILTGVAWYMLLQFKEKWKNVSIRYVMMIPLAFYCLYLFAGLCSITWSTNAPFSMLQLSMTLETFVFSIIFYKVLIFYDNVYERKIPVIAALLSRAVFIHSIWFIIGAIFDPDFYFRTTHGGTVARLGGLIINPNELGLLANIGIGAAYIEILNEKNKKFQALNILVTVVMLLMTQSRGSLFCFMFISSIYLLLTKSYTIKIGAVVVAILVVPVLIQKIVLKDGDFEEVASFTGRKEFWEDLVNEGFPEHPLIGRGFMSIAENTWFNKYQSTHSYTASMCHNTYVEVITNLGLLGVFICGMQVLWTIVAIIISKKKILRLMALFMLFTLLINSITEFGIFGHNNYAIMFYHFVFLFFTVQGFRKEEVLITPLNIK